MAEKQVYRVIVTDNIVCALERVPHTPDLDVARDELEVSTKLSQNNLRNGRLDGTYYFDNPDHAKEFAVLCLDFTKRLIDRTIDRLEYKQFSVDLRCDNPHHGHD